MTKSVENEATPEWLSDECEGYDAARKEIEALAHYTIHYEPFPALGQLPPRMRGANPRVGFEDFFGRWISIAWERAIKQVATKPEHPNADDVLDNASRQAGTKRLFTFVEGDLAVAKNRATHIYQLLLGLDHGMTAAPFPDIPQNTWQPEERLAHAVWEHCRSGSKTFYVAAHQRDIETLYSVLGEIWIYQNARIPDGF